MGVNCFYYSLVQHTKHIGEDNTKVIGELENARYCMAYKLSCYAIHQDSPCMNLMHYIAIPWKLINIIIAFIVDSDV